jgi:DNA-binding response OmpR family regulator
MRILFTEDESRRNFQAGALKSRLHAEARAALATHPHDAVFLDLGLAQATVFNCSPRCEQMVTPHRVLVLTARDVVKDRVCFLDSGADDYLVRPFAISQLIFCVDRAGPAESS